ncbi:MAG: TonB-dependent receptor [Rikenellaceae bacterium]
MKNLKFRILRRITLAVFCFSAILAFDSTYAQNVQISGSVISAADGQPIIGATISYSEGTAGTVTDLDGNFTISNIPSNDVIKINFLGYVPQEHAVVGGKRYDISLIADSQSIDEVIVVGYGTMRKKEVTGSVARVEAEQIVKFSTADVGSALQGQIAGVNVQASSGAPGDVANVQIRGISSVNGSNTPLYVVDGVPYDGDPGLSPQEIESIDVLKDAASAAIYGTRGSGGVILITTKKGSAGEVKVSFDAYYGVQKITSSLSLLSATEQVYVDYIRNPEGVTFHSDWTSMRDSPNSYLNDTNMIDIIELDYQPIYNASVNISGGTDNVVYSFIANYYDQSGVILNSGYDRLNLRGNVTFKKKKWTLSANMASKTENTLTQGSSLYSQVYSYSPTNKEIDPDMELDTSADVDNLTSYANALAKFKETTETVRRSFNGNFSLGYQITDDLSFTSRLGTGSVNRNSTWIKPYFEIYDDEGELQTQSDTSRSRIRQTNSVNTSFTWEQMLSYGKKWNDHDLRGTAVFGTEKYTYDIFYADRYDLSDNDAATLSSATGEMTVSEGDNTVTTLMGMLLRAQYSFKDRYMFSGSIRRDGSSRFAEQNRWGYFPSASAGWNISDEEFFSPLRSVVNNMKIRASFGTTGNQNFDDYQMSSTVETGYDYAFGSTSGDSFYLGSTQVDYTNADVKWETTKQYNVGVDMFFFDSKVSVTADIYKSYKSDMLLPLTVPESSGAGDGAEVIMNVGNMTNQGVELAIGYRDNIGDFNYSINGTFTKNVNEVTQMSGTNKMVALGSIWGAGTEYDVTYLAEGYEAGAYFLMPTNGIINTADELAEYQQLNANAKMGDLIYVDTNGDGVINSDSDRVYCGSGAPEIELGLNYNIGWKGIDLSMSWYASLGNEIYNGSKLLSYQRGRDKDLLYSWSETNQLSTIPVARTSSHANLNGLTDYWIEDGSFLRLRNISLGYSIPKSKIASLGLSKLRVYVAADNILTFTAYRGYDPEVGNDGLSTRGLDSANYPISAQMRGGIQLDF